MTWVWSEVRHHVPHLWGSQASRSRSLPMLDPVRYMGRGPSTLRWAIFGG